MSALHRNFDFNSWMVIYSNFLLGFQIESTASTYSVESVLSISSIVFEDEKGYTCAVFNLDKEWLNISKSLYVEVRGKLRKTTYCSSGVTGRKYRGFFEISSTSANLGGII